MQKYISSDYFSIIGKAAILLDSKCLVWANMDGAQLGGVSDVSLSIESLRLEPVPSSLRVGAWLQGQMGSVIQVELVHDQLAGAGKHQPGAPIVTRLHPCCCQTLHCRLGNRTGVYKQ